MKENFFFNAICLWKNIVYNAERDGTFELDTYKKLFNIFQVGEHYYYIFNFADMQAEFVSRNIENVLGCRHDIDMRTFMEKIHPNDSVYYLNFESAAIAFLKELPYEKLGKYKVQYDFRIMNARGNYVRVLHQAILIHFDEDKNFYRSLALHTDITHIKKSGAPCLSFIGIDGEPSFINVKAPAVFKQAGDTFTNREKEILQLVVAGKTSEEIAGALMISLHTVHTHRKNILSKSGARSPLELVHMTIANGWI